MIVQQVRREHIKAVFVENIRDPRLVQQLGREAGVQVQGELYSDALSRAGGPAPTYLQLVRHNVQLLARAMR
jgi:zinc/manganese transport system substrate-binding protein